jgi:hypothetical protein
MAYELKTKATEAGVDDFIDAVADPQRREDARTALAMLGRVTGEPAKMWGPSIVGFGQYHYKYASGHEGTMARIGFSPRAKEMVFYFLDGSEEIDSLLPRLGKHKTGKCCLYVKRLSDVDGEVLEEIAVRSWRNVNARYPEDA